MNHNFALAISQGATRLLNSDNRGHLIGILAVFVPFFTVALIGESLGTDTSFAAALVITLAYLLAIVIATVVLKSQGSGWRKIGLARPKSWPKRSDVRFGERPLSIRASLLELFRSYTGAGPRN